MVRARVFRYGLAMAACLLALLPWELWGANLEPSPFPLFVAAIMVASWYGGIGPGLLASFASSVLNVYVYLAPVHTLALDSVRSGVQLAVFVLVALFVTWLNVQRGRAEGAGAQLAAIVESSQDAIIGKTLNGTITSWNPAAERLYGYGAGEMLGRPICTIVPPERQDELREIMERVKAGEGTNQRETVRLARDGRRIPVSITVSPIHDGRGAIIGASTIARDVTDRYRAQEERDRLLVAEQEARARAEAAERNFAFLAEASKVLSSSLDYEATLASVARLAVPTVADWCTVHVLEDDGVVRQLAVEHVDPARVALARDLERRFPVDPDAPTGVAVVLRTGEAQLYPEIAAEALASVIEEPDLLRTMRDLGLESAMAVPMRARERVVGAIQFVAAESGRHYAESDLHLAQDLADRAALAIDNARLYQASVRVAAERSAILTNMADGVIITDPQGRISYVNPAACTTLGLAETELMGMELTDLVESVGLEGAKGERLMPEGSALSTALQGETVRRVERRITRRDGSEVILQVSAAPLRVEGVGFAGAVSVFRDVTPERTLEVQKDAFLSAVAHDLKNPLAGIKTLTQMLERRAGRSEDPDFAKMREGLGRIDVTTNRLTAMVNELLDVTRMQMGRPVEMDRRPVDLVELVRRVSAEHQHTTGWHPINVTVHPPQIVGHWDASRLERVVANLLSNAIKYSPGGGEIRVTIAEEVCDGTRAAVLSVDDRGMGIPEADLPFVFDRFHRGRNVAGRIPGTGIGLSGAQFIVQEHGGRIRVESREGEGTTFTVILPVEGGGPHPSVRPPGS